MTLGNKQSHSIENEMNEFQTKLKLWHIKYQKTKNNNVVLQASTWEVIKKNPRILTFKAMNEHQETQSSHECIAELLDIFYSHPSYETLDVVQEVDDHIYNMF